MKKPTRHHWTIGLLSINAAIALLAAGCSSTADSDYYYYNGEKVHGARSYNSDYNDNLVTKPTYWIHDETENSFQVTVQQGVPSNGAERIVDAKTAASGVAKAEATRLGWTKSHLDYISETDQGWMHVVVAKVTPGD
jgi:hypothetical protein